MIQIVKRKCCGSVFAACVEPDCYTDKDWLKNLKEYVNRGDKVEMIESGTLKFGGKCRGYTVLATVPYQCCPVCNGNGKTVADGFTSSVYQTCKVCLGAMIIPMHVLLKVNESL
jgi:hypothetical protein